MTSEVNRRTFLASVAATGGALALGFAIPFGPQPAQAAASATEITAWIVIRPDDTVTIRIAKSEMGQGSFTGLAMLVAEELECDWGKVRAEFAPPHDNLARNRVWGDMSTGGSRSIRNSHEMLRKAGATAREMLIAAAAAQWNVASRRMPRRRRRGHAHAERPHRRAIGAVAEAAAAHRAAAIRHAQGAEGLDADRQADAAARDRRQGAGQDHLRHRRARCPTCSTPR